MRAVAYVRVSTAEQHPENQVRELRELAARHGFTAKLEFRTEVESAAKQRPVLDQLMKDCRSRRVSALLVWALDRLDRSMAGVINRVLELDHLGVRVLSVRDGWLDTAGPARSLLLAVLGWMAEQERARIAERTKAGLARAVASGKRLGRPRAALAPLERAAKLAEGGASVRRAAEEAGVSYSVLQRHLAQKRQPAAPH